MPASTGNAVKLRWVPTLAGYWVPQFGFVKFALYVSKKCGNFVTKAELALCSRAHWDTYSAHGAQKTANSTEIPS